MAQTKTIFFLISIVLLPYHTFQTESQCKIMYLYFLVECFRNLLITKYISVCLNPLPICVKKKNVSNFLTMSHFKVIALTVWNCNQKSKYFIGISIDTVEFIQNGYNTTSHAHFEKRN